MSVSLDKSGYSRIADNGETVWACCTSAIGPTCQHRASTPQSGYTPCACRDCMDTTVSSDITNPELCSECEDAGCEPGQSESDAYECQRDDVYGA